MDLIIYHRKCPDGFCAAYIAKKRYPEAELLGLDHGEPVPFDRVREKDVLVVDFSWPVREDNERLHASAKSFHIFDHHKTAKERLEGLGFITFDMNKSGAGITWDTLFGFDNPRPWWVNYVEDRDLWRHALPDSKSVSAYIMSLPFKIEAWDHLDNITSTEAASLGNGILRHIDRYVSEAFDQAQYGLFEDLSVAVVNCPYMNCSEVGNILAKTADVGITWFERADGMIQFSLRSEDNIDVSRIAKIYGGGGHLHAAGFRLSLQEGREWLDAVLGRE